MAGVPEGLRPGATGGNRGVPTCFLDQMKLSLL